MERVAPVAPVRSLAEVPVSPVGRTAADRAIRMPALEVLALKKIQAATPTRTAAVTQMGPWTLEVSRELAVLVVLVVPAAEEVVLAAKLKLLPRLHKICLHLLAKRFALAKAIKRYSTWRPTRS